MNWDQNSSRIHLLMKLGTHSGEKQETSFSKELT